MFSPKYERSIFTLMQNKKQNYSFFIFKICYQKEDGDTKGPEQNGEELICT
jgi:hypothetical protein